VRWGCPRLNWHQQHIGYRFSFKSNKNYSTRVTYWSEFTRPCVQDLKINLALIKEPHQIIWLKASLKCKRNEGLCLVRSPPVQPGPRQQSLYTACMTDQPSITMFPTSRNFSRVTRRDTNVQQNKKEDKK
jgi:hypothetical protein